MEHYFIRLPLRKYQANRTFPEVQTVSQRNQPDPEGRTVPQLESDCSRWPDWCFFRPVEPTPQALKFFCHVTGIRCKLTV